MQDRFGPTVMTSPTPAAMTSRESPSRPAPSAFFWFESATIWSIQGAATQFDTAVSLGFDAVLLASPFASEGGRLADPDALHAGLGGGEAAPALRGLADAAHARGLSLFLDIALDRVAVDAALARDHPDWFSHDGDAAAFCYLAATDPAVDWWDGRIAAWQSWGIDGLSIREAHQMPPPVLARLVAAAHARQPGWTAMAVAFGATPQEIAALVSSGFDYAASSSCWWDGRAPWLAEDLARIGAVGRVLSFAVPPSPSPAPADRRALRLAGFLGSAWVMNASVEPDRHDLVRGINRLRHHHRALFVRAPEILSPPHAPESLLGRFEPEGGGLVLALAPTGETPDPFRLRGWIGERGGMPEPIDLADAEPSARLYHTPPPRVVRLPARARPKAQAGLGIPRIGFEAVTPSVEGGRFAARRIVGERVVVEADLICDGHGKLAADLLWRAADRTEWQRAPMAPLGNDRWTAAFDLDCLGRYQFAIEAWVDRYGAFADEIAKKQAANVAIDLELIEGAALVEAALSSADAEQATILRAVLDGLDAAPSEERARRLGAPATIVAMRAAENRKFVTKYGPVPVEAERGKAGFAAWYEIFPRSQSDDESRHGTFDDVIAQLPRIRAMGFDVLYFPPIHPIGRKNRKGPNNSLTPTPDDPGSPYAIGGVEGGHDAIHPELGDFASFRRLLAAAADRGLEIALDFAIQCAPDHPWLAEHPEWFDWRPDGSIKYAENPPKKYEDIVNVDFYREGAMPALWVALRDIVAFWVEQGVRIFRVDNPHTKPLPFWEWMIADIRARDPGVIFLAEAFTRPKLMYRLAKLGFSQSYTYFTWRDTAAELREYLTELTTTAPRDFFRPHFFVNTPDINPVFLQSSGRPGFLIRAALAATLSGLWGVYNGFELCEAAALPGREEYLDSEKYQLRAWDHERPGNIVAEIAALNRIRRQNPALHSHLGIAFLPCDNPDILYYEKANADRSNVLLIAVSLDPFGRQTGGIELPLWRFGLHDEASLHAEDLVRDLDFVWHGKRQIVSLDPGELPYCIWRIRA
ncbi:MAG: maltotransferase domain-containing protein [Acidiphilium sp.]